MSSLLLCKHPVLKRKEDAKSWRRAYPWFSDMKILLSFEPWRPQPLKFWVLKALKAHLWGLKGQTKFCMNVYTSCLFPFVVFVFWKCFLWSPIPMILLLCLPSFSCVISRSHCNTLFCMHQRCSLSFLDDQELRICGFSWGLSGPKA